MICHSKVHNLYGYNMAGRPGRPSGGCAPTSGILMSPLLLYRYAPLRRRLDRRQQFLVVSSAVEPENDALPEHVLDSSRRCGSGAASGKTPPETCRCAGWRPRRIHAVDAQPRRHGHPREQEFYQFENPGKIFAHVIGVRYRLIPYLYSEYLKAASTTTCISNRLALCIPRIHRQTDRGPADAGRRNHDRSGAYPERLRAARSICRRR